MLNPVPILAVLPIHPTLIQSIEFIFSGFVFVLIVLAAMWILTSMVGMIFIRLDKKAAPKAASVKVAPVAAVAPAEDTNLPAVVAAAVYAVMEDKPHRIVQIRPADDSWAREGRRSILGSHKVR